MAEILDQSRCFAKFAEMTERWDDSCHYVAELAKQAKFQLAEEDRVLFQRAFKSAVAKRRQALRVIDDEDKSGQQFEQYRKEIMDELQTKCSTLLDLCPHMVQATAHDIDAKIFYQKMGGDFFRYLAEFAPKENKETYAKHADTYYSQGMEDAKALDPAHSTRLGLALNYSVFHKEVMHDALRANQVAQLAVTQAEQVFGQQEYHDTESKELIKMLRDNLKQWSGEKDGLAPEFDGTVVEDF